MGTSSEDVLLSVANVRNNKRDGTLYVMAERLAWIVNGKNTFSLSYKYSQIKMQKISPEGKSKIQLQVVLHSSDASTFHFTNPAGEQAQIKDRNDVKELLQQLLPKFRSKITKELEEKNRILEEDPHLLNLYQNLVISQIITADEFWANHANHKLSGEKTVESNQSVGVSASFLSDVKPQTDGCNGLKYNLNADIIHSIFKTYPSVKRKHMENVPDRMTESEFWTMFFQSHYFHRDRFNAGSKDIFSECAKNDDQELRSQLNKGIENPLVDIDNFVDTIAIDGYGIARDNVHAKQIHNTNQSMIRRFNQHSMKILGTCDADIAKSDGRIKIASTKEQNGSTADETRLPDPKRLKLLEKIEYEDLEVDSKVEVAPLNLQKLERYLHGPVPVTNTSYVSSDEMLSTLNYLHKDITPWKSDLTNVLSGQSAITVLGELSPGGILMKSSQSIQLNDLTLKNVQSELRNLYPALTELLRHFWSCFPPTTPFLEEKIVRVYSSIERFQQSKLNTFKNTLIQENQNLNLTSHLEQMIEAAAKKFHTWQSKSKRR